MRFFGIKCSNHLCIHNTKNAKEIPFENLVDLTYSSYCVLDSIKISHWNECENFSCNEKK